MSTNRSHTVRVIREKGCALVYTLLEDGLEIFSLHSDLAHGSLKGVREKFALAKQRAALEEIVAEIENGKLYLGDVAKGEIQITGIARVISNRFWAEVEYKVLFPGKNGGPSVAGTYRCVRWNVGVESGTAALCITADRRIVLTRSFRHASRGWRLEIPRGARKSGETLEACGFREALEEAGAQRTDATQVVNLGTIEPDSGLAMQFPSIVAYTNVTIDESRIHADVSESVSGSCALPLDDVHQLIRSGEIVDSFTIAAIYKAQLHGIL